MQREAQLNTLLEPSPAAMADAAHKQVVRVGVGVLVTRGGSEVLVGQRRGSHGAGDWALPGGHLEVGETWEACAARELEEETGIRLSEPPVFAAVNNSVMSSTKYALLAALPA